MSEKAYEHFLQRISNINIHGFPKVYTGPGTVRRIVWLILSLGAAAFSLFGIYQSAIIYSNYPVKVSVSYKDERQTDFPAVTFCNLEDRGQAFSTMLLSCIYKRRLCNADHFHLINDSIKNYDSAEFGVGDGRDAYYIQPPRNCYTFNSGLGKTMAVTNEMMAGRESALTVSLLTKPPGYFDATPGLGFSVTILKSGEFPTSECKTVSASPGFSTFIELSMVSHSIISLNCR